MLAFLCDFLQCDVSIKWNSHSSLQAEFSQSLTMIMMMFLLVIIGVGRKVKIRELTAIADDDDHVIWVRKYASLQKAIQKAVNTKIGKNAI